MNWNLTWIDQFKFNPAIGTCNNSSQNLGYVTKAMELGYVTKAMELGYVTKAMELGYVT